MYFSPLQCLGQKTPQMDQLITVIIWAALFQGFFLGILFLTSKSSGSFSNKLLGLFLLALVVEAIGSFLPYDEVFGYPLNGYFLIPETKILFPLFFIHYVLEKLGVAQNYKRFLNFNYGLALLVICITPLNILSFLITGTTIQDYFSEETLEVVFLIQQVYGFILSLTGLLLAIIETLKYKQLIKGNYSDMDLLSINWLWQFILLLVPATLLWGAELVRIFLGFYTGNFTSWDFVDVTWGVLTIFIYVVSYQAFRHKDLIEDSISPSQLPHPVQAIEEEPDSTLETDLTQAMEQDKLFLQPDLTIHNVAKAVNTSTRKVSVCINRCFDANFSEWVNKYRVAEVKEKFLDDASQHYTIEAVGQEAGFKSRSAMYTAFNKFAGNSPAYYRNKQSRQAQAS